MNAGLLIIILLLGLALLGFPIYIALGIGALAALNLADLPLIVLPQRMFAGMNGSALLAIPFFILAGNIMSRSITGKLIDICNAIIGHIKGSLSLVTFWPPPCSALSPAPAWPPPPPSAASPSPP